MAATRKMKRGWLPSRPTPVPADVLESLYDLGIDVRHVEGREANARCYAHYSRVEKYDRNPSFFCNLDTGVFLCFSCGWTGPFVLLVSEVLGVPWEEAASWVRKRGGIARVHRILGRTAEEEVQELRKPVEPVTEADLALYCDPPQEERAKRGLSLESCRSYGILWDPVRDMWIFPIRRADGTLIGWQEKNERHFKNHPRSVKKSTSLFGYHLLAPGSTAVLVESPPDCARILTVGIPGAVSSYGSSVSDEQMQLLLARCKKIIIAMDNDEAGWKTAESLRDRYRGMGQRFAFYHYTSSVKDPGDQSGEEIRFGVERALSPLRVRFGMVA